LSTSAAIPHFRNPGKGLHCNLRTIYSPNPAAAFDTMFFHTDSQPFFTLLKCGNPGRFTPIAMYAPISQNLKILFHGCFTYDMGWLARAARLILRTPTKARQSCGHIHGGVW
ncbi:hypothetical protein HOY80DRAFT_886005, partial [Tuber brumale]